MVAGAYFSRAGFFRPSLGQLHDNYSDFSTSQGSPSNFEDCVIWNLIDLENANYIPLPHAVAADNGEVTLTIGYGLDVDGWRINMSPFLLSLFALRKEMNETISSICGSGFFRLVLMPLSM